MLTLSMEWEANKTNIQVVYHSVSYGDIIQIEEDAGIVSWLQNRRRPLLPNLGFRLLRRLLNQRMIITGYQSLLCTVLIWT
jgi:hypothetical protein